MLRKLNLIYANRINSRSMSRGFCGRRSQKTPRGVLPVNSDDYCEFFMNKLVFKCAKCYNILENGVTIQQSL